MYCKLGRKGCLTIAALRPVFWTGLEITTILLPKREQHDKLTKNLCTHHSYEDQVGVCWSRQNSVVIGKN